MPNDKKEEFRCPVCGEILISSRAGIWCLNPDCPVTDDSLLYEIEIKKKKEARLDAE